MFDRNYSLNNDCLFNYNKFPDQFLILYIYIYTHTPFEHKIK